MGAEILSSRAIRGMFYEELESTAPAPWVNDLSFFVDSDQSEEQYAWLGMVPALRQWVGGRNAQVLRDFDYTIANEDYEATIEFLRKDLTLDKTDQTRTRIRELAVRTNEHWEKILSTLIVAGESATCYDSQFFFDDDHSEGDSGSQSNDITVDISALPATTSGTTTAPSVEEFALSALKGIQQLFTLVDDQGEPVNQGASRFTLMIPPSLMYAGIGAIGQELQGYGASNILKSAGFEYNLVINPRVSDWTDCFAVFRADGTIKPLIRQQQGDYLWEEQSEGSGVAFREKKHQYGVSVTRAAGYGRWQHACLVTME